MKNGYPFGMAMPARDYSTSSYRYGFNGKERDKDLHSLTAYDYGFRIYNPAIGKFLSVDPLMKDYPSWSPYPFAMNRPIDGIDLDGLEYTSSVKAKVTAYVDYNPMIKQITEVSALTNYQNLSGNSKMQLHSKYNLPGNFYDQNISLALEVSSIKFKPLTAVDAANTLVPAETLEKGLEESEGGKATFSYTSPTVNNVSKKFRSLVTKANGISGIKNNVIEFTGQAKIDKANAYITAITWGLQLIGETIFTADENTTLRNQGGYVTGTIATYLVNSIESNVIPEINRNNKDLTAIANYLLSGEIPKLTTPGGNTETNHALLKIAKGIWSTIEADKKADQKKRAMDRAEKEQLQPNRVDKTSVKTTQTQSP